MLSKLILYFGERPEQFRNALINEVVRLKLKSEIILLHLHIILLREKGAKFFDSVVYIKSSAPFD